MTPYLHSIIWDFNDCIRLSLNLKLLSAESMKQLGLWIFFFLLFLLSPLFFRFFFISSILSVLCFCFIIFSSCLGQGFCPVFSVPTSVLAVFQLHCLRLPILFLLLLSLLFLCLKLLLCFLLLGLLVMLQYHLLLLMLLIVSLHRYVSVILIL